MNKVDFPVKCNKGENINFNGEEFECLKEFELLAISTKSYL